MHDLTSQEREAKRLEQCRAAGKKGGKALSERWSRVRNFALRKASENRKSGTAKIAHAIAQEVIDFALKRDMEMSPSNASRLISRWMREDKKASQR
jgi:hypothetical protein